MNNSILPASFATLAAISVIGATVTKVIADERVPIIKDPLVKEECSACHMAYQPQFLPATSWRKIMDGLDAHFGEDASLDAQTTRRITNYLAKHAGGNRSDAGITITGLNWFVKEHRREVSAQAKKKAGTMANCTACHKGADRGLYDDD